MLPLARRCLLVGASAILLARGALAEEPPPQGPNQQQIETWLATKPASADISKKPEAPEAPPPPPRRHGFVVESSAGALGQVGDLRHVSPLSPWIRGAFGWEPTHWIMLLAQGDVAFGSTAYANPPPDPRGYALWALSAAVRLGYQASPTVGLYVQGELGATRVTNDVLSSYGFRDANQAGPYFGGLIGLDWYQVSPHYALVLQGGARSYAQVLGREGGSAAMGWIGALGLKYTL
jgi:hypothetical protein